jgi:hypothetical protein
MEKQITNKRFRIRLPEKPLVRLLVYLGIAFLINLVVFCIMHSQNYIYYELNDDFAIQSHLNGSMGDYYTYFPNMNVVLLSILSSLYQVFSGVNWYGLYMLFALMISWAFVGSVLMQKLGLKIGLPLYALLVPISFGLLLTHFTYTVISYSLLAAAIACLVCAFYTKDKMTRRFLYVFSIIMLLSALLMRLEVVVSMAAYVGVFVLFMLIKYKKRALGFVGAAAVAVAAFGACYAAEAAYYGSNEDAGEFKEYYEARVSVVDNAPLDYARHAEGYAQIGWGELDLYMLQTFTFPDDPKFSTENFNYAASIRQDIRYMDDGGALWSNFITTFTEGNFVMLIILFGAFVAAFFFSRQKILPVVLLALPFLFQLLFAVLWRTPFRIVYPHYLVSIAALLCLIDPEKLVIPTENLSAKAFVRRLGTLLCVGTAAVAGMLFVNMFLLQSWAGAEKNADRSFAAEREAFEYFSGDKEHAYVYMTSNPLLDVCQSYSIFHTFEKDYFSNSRLMGGWDTRSPSYYAFLDRYSMTALPIDIIDNEDVYFVLPDTGILTEYFFERHEIAVKYETVYEINDFLTVCRVLSTTEEEKGLVY